MYNHVNNKNNVKQELKSQYALFIEESKKKRAVTSR